MKKSLLCILLVCVLMLGGCVLTDLPVETEGMVESAEMIIDLRYMHSVLQYLCDCNAYIIRSGNMPKTMEEFEKAYDSIRSECQRLKENTVPQCVKFLKSSMQNEQKLNLLLDDFERAGKLYIEAFLLMEQNPASIHQTATKENAFEEGVSLTERLNEEIVHLVEIWEESVLSLPNIAPEKMQKILNYKSAFVYLYTTVSAAHILDRCHRALEVQLQETKGSKAFFADFPIQAINDVVLLAQNLTTQYETASAECQKLYEPFYLKVVTVIASKSALLSELARNAQNGIQISIEELQQYDQSIEEWMKDMLDDLIDEEYILFDNFRKLV